MKKAAIYIRVSSAQQAQEGDSVPAQREALRKYIQEHDNLVFAGEYCDDGVSGTRSDRDELTRLLGDVKKKKVDIILVTKLDRLYRSIKHYLNMMDTLDKYGVGWVAIWEKIYDTTTPQGRLIVNQMMSIAQFEAEQTGQRLRQVQAYKLTQKEVISGSVPVGFRIQDKHLVHDDNAPLARLAFETYSRTGTLNQTMREMCVYSCFPSTKPAFKRMLSNTLYVGTHPSGVADYCPPIVSEELFNDVQRKLSMNLKSNSTQVYLFSGLIRCKECGCAFGANTRRRMRGKGLKIIHQYRCAKHYNQKPPLCDNAKVILETALERYLIDNLVQLTKDAIYRYEVEQAPVKAKAKQSAGLKRKLNRLKEAYLNGVIELEEYKQDKANIEEQLKALEPPQNAPQAPTRALKGLLMGNIGGIYETLSEAEKRRFWRGIIDRIEFDKNRVITVFFLGVGSNN